MGARGGKNAKGQVTEHRDIPSLLAFKELREDPTEAPVKCVPRGSNACHDGSHRRVLPVRSFPAERCWNGGSLELEFRKFRVKNVELRDMCSKIRKSTKRPRASVPVLQWLLHLPSPRFSIVPPVPPLFLHLFKSSPHVLWNLFPVMVFSWFPSSLSWFSSWLPHLFAVANQWLETAALDMFQWTHEGPVHKTARTKAL